MVLSKRAYDSSLDTIFRGGAVLTIGLLCTQDKSVKLQASKQMKGKPFKNTTMSREMDHPTDPNSELAVTGPKESRKQPNQETGQILVL